MSLEIERKFLLEATPVSKSDLNHRQALRQGYVQLDENRELRVRAAGESYTLTAKYGSGMVRRESEQSIDRAIFELLWPFTEGKRLEKVRYRFDCKGYDAELDIYSGDLAGLLVMEIEFSNELEANAFVPPDYCKREVTGDPRFKNANLAQTGLPT